MIFFSIKLQIVFFFLTNSCFDFCYNSLTSLTSLIQPFLIFVFLIHFVSLYFDFLVFGFHLCIIGFRVILPHLLLPSHSVSSSSLFSKYFCPPHTTSKCLFSPLFLIPKSSSIFFFLYNFFFISRCRWKKFRSGQQKFPAVV